MLLVDKVDPPDRRQAKNSAKKVETARDVRRMRASLTKEHGASRHNAKHRKEWKNTLATYVFLSLGSAPVGDVDVAMVTKSIEPLWATKPETAVRPGRVGAGLGQGPKVTRWREPGAMPRAFVEPSGRGRRTSF